METKGGVSLTEKQIKNIKSLKRVLQDWDKDLSINSIAGTLTILLVGDTKQNHISDMSETGGFNPENEVWSTGKVLNDGGDW